MTWNIIQSASDIETLQNTFGGFHDGCIRECHVWTEHWVDYDLSMSCPGELDTHVRILFQRQFRDPSAVEVQFDQVVQFHINPTPESYDSIIYGATCIIQDGIYYWASEENWSLNPESRDGATWIGSKRMKWRDASSFMGSRLRYRSADDAEEL